MTEKQWYAWATPSGPINLIKADDMPVYAGDQCSWCAEIIERECECDRGYNTDLQSAKESSVPIQDQERAKRMIMQWLNDQPLGQGMIERDRVHGPFTVEYRIEDACAHDSCPVDGMCEHCKEPVNVAILYDDTPEEDIDTQFAESAKAHIRNAPAKTYRAVPEKEPQEDSIESLRKELAECKQAYNQQCERNTAIAKDLEYWAQRSADLMKELEQLRKQ